LFIPEKFSLAADLQEVIKFIAKLKAYSKIPEQVFKVNLDLDKVEHIDIGAISLLLSSIKELALKNIKVQGNLPKHPACEQYIIDSGFLEHLNILSSTVKRKINTIENESRNSMLMNGRDKTDHRRIGQCIKTSMKKICGYERHYQPLYGVIGEMNINSLEHAYRRNKHWLFAVNFEKKTEKLIFTFTDNGYGIYTRLKRNFGLKAFELLGLTTELKIVEGMFDEKYNSRFKKQYNRNKGLPAIKALQEKKKVTNLIIITNKVYINFATGKKIQLENDFSGTFYYWELDKNVING
jgi:hypothetical protein